MIQQELFPMRKLETGEWIAYAHRPLTVLDVVLEPLDPKDDEDVLPFELRMLSSVWTGDGPANAREGTPLRLRCEVELSAAFIMLEYDDDVVAALSFEDYQRSIEG